MRRALADKNNNGRYKKQQSVAGAQSGTGAASNGQLCKGERIYEEQT